MSYTVKVKDFFRDSYKLKPLSPDEYYEGYNDIDPNEELDEIDLNNSGEEKEEQDLYEHFIKTKKLSKNSKDLDEKSIKAKAYLQRAMYYYKRSSFLLANTLIQKGLDIKCEHKITNEKLEKLLRKSNEAFTFRMNYSLLEAKAAYREKMKKQGENLEPEDLKKDNFDINMQFKNKTLLFRACKRGNKELAEFLLDHKADNKNDLNLVDIAVKNDRFDLIRFLVGRGFKASSDSKHPDKDEKTSTINS